MGIVNTTVFTSDTETVTRTKLNSLVANLLTEFNGSVDNSNIKAAAGIVYSKLLLTDSIVNADINSAAAIAYSKLDLAGAVQNSDLATIDTAGKVDGAALTALENTPSGAGNIPVENLGAAGTISGNKTFSGDIQIGTSNQGDIYYDDGSKIARLTPGTSGDFLQTQGAAANPQWASVPTPESPGFEFIDSGTFSSTNLVTITESMVNGDLYKLVVEGQMTQNTSIKFNINSNSGTNFDWYRTGDAFQSPSSWIDIRDVNTGTTNVNFEKSGYENRKYQLTIDIATRNSDTYGRFDWHGYAYDNLDTQFIDYHGAFAYYAGTVTTMQLIGTNSRMAGTWYLYKYKTS